MAELTSARTSYLWLEEPILRRRTGGQLFVACTAVLMAGLVIATLFAMNWSLENALSPSFFSNGSSTNSQASATGGPKLAFKTYPAIAPDPIPAATPLTDPLVPTVTTGHVVPRTFATKVPVGTKTVVQPVPSPAAGPAGAIVVPVVAQPPVIPTVPAVQDATPSTSFPTVSTAPAPTAQTAASSSQGTPTNTNTIPTGISTAPNGHHEGGSQAQVGPTASPTGCLDTDGDGSATTPDSDGDDCTGTN